MGIFAFSNFIRNYVICTRILIFWFHAPPVLGSKLESELFRSKKMDEVLAFVPENSGRRLWITYTAKSFFWHPFDFFGLYSKIIFLKQLHAAFNFFISYGKYPLTVILQNKIIRLGIKLFDAGTDSKLMTKLKQTFSKSFCFL